MSESRIPTREEINVFDSLDERSAVEHFLGKSVAEAEALFHENALHYFEDLMWMGPNAFRYYIPAAIRYLEDPQCRDACAVRCFTSVIDSRLHDDPHEVRPIARELHTAFDYLSARAAEFEIDAVERDQLKTVRTRLSQL